MDSTTTMEETISTDYSPSPPPPPPPPPPLPPLQRMGSGDSAIIDPPDSTSSSSAQPLGRKLPSSQFKGVVPQPNGRWGAQIYEKHHRVWLGTFGREAAAARAYDAAALRFRGLSAATNFTPPSDPELRFLASRSKAEVVDMLRKHTYAHELSSAGSAGHQPPAFLPAREALFGKAVTPSDVGKLNRLVIPKQHAEKHFPADALSTGPDSGCGAALLNFQDGGGKLWRFRYSYWNSSQSYVLTRGWSRFVKEKGLRAGDVVRFERSTGSDRQLYIDFTAAPAASAAPGLVVRLFGVDILAVEGCEGRKRRREVELVKPGQCRREGN